jgi:nucleotide-binding universal stress UspA family protein
MALFPRPRPADVLDGMVHYLVDTPDGAVGVVDGWQRDPRGHPQSLIVAQGWFGRRRFEVPLDALLEIDHEERRVVLRRDAAPLEPKGPLQRLVEFGQGSAEEAAATVRQSPHRVRPVLCGVADDHHAAAVVAVAARLARELAAPLVVVHVTPAGVPPGVSAAADGRARLLAEEKTQAGELIDALLSGLSPGTAVKRVVVRGRPAETLEEVAGTERAQLLVIGASRKGSLRALLAGSVSQHVTGHARCAVVVVPPDVTGAEANGGRDSSDMPELAGVGFGR